MTSDQRELEAISSCETISVYCYEYLFKPSDYGNNKLTCWLS